ncbi:hypothetical protein ACJJTC_002919 [Scirpophaga incertulas]
MATGGEELWRECASWLTRCGLLRPDHKANWETSTIHDLAYTLRDGVLICNLLNVLHPGCIDMKDVNQRPQMAQFLCMRNIKVFLRTCHEVFELRETDLFDPSMLFDLSNFHRVLCTLAKLSQCPKALSKNIKPFSAHRTQSEEDIYKDLQSVACVSLEAPTYSLQDSPERSAQAEVPWVQFTIPSATCEDRVEEIYEDLCYVKFTSAMPELATSSHSLEKRDYVIRELVDTECNYVDVLSKIVKYFLRPLTPYLKPQDLQVIFFGIKELHETHSGLLRQLRLATEACVPGSGAPRLPTCSWRGASGCCSYGEYCSNLTPAQDALKALDARDATFSKQLAKCQKEHSDGRIQLRDILSVPMQRVLKYHLLLDKLVHETQPNHEEFRGLERAKEAMVDVAQYINEVKRDSEVLALLAKVQESIIDWEGGALGAGGAGLAAYGRLLLDGELKVKAHEDQKLRTRYVFVFDKLMLLCKPVKDNQYSYRLGVRLAEYRVEEGCGRRTLRGDARWAATFYLVRRSKDATFTLYARSDDCRRKWVAAIRDAIDNLEPAGLRSTNHKFILHTFEKPATCHHCSKFLKGRIFQVRGRDGPRHGDGATGAARGRHFPAARAAAPRPTGRRHRHQLRALAQNGQHGEAYARVPQAHRSSATLLPVRVTLLPQYCRARLLLREDQPVGELYRAQLVAAVAVPARGGDRGARLPAAGLVAAGAAARRQGARHQQGGRRPRLVEGPRARQGRQPVGIFPEGVRA